MLSSPLWALALLACKPPPGDLGDGVCGEVSRERGELVCRHRIADQQQWQELTVESRVQGELRTTKWLIPASESAKLPTLFVNSQLWALHSDMLAAAFSDLYPGVDQAQYSRMVLQDPPELYSGNISEYRRSDGSTFFGFIVWDDPARRDTTVTYQEVLTVWKELSAATDLGPLHFVPNSLNQEAAALLWDAPFVIDGRDELNYEVYNPGVAYGTLRLQPLSELADDEETAAFGWQDILVLDQAPIDLERVVSGIVTGTRQGALSHLNVRSAARGTPNCYVRAPFDALSDWQGQLVRFECGEQEFEISVATQEQAEQWWQELRPDPVSVPTPDFDSLALLDLLELPTDTQAQRDAGVAAYGAKGSNLATLYQRIPYSLQLNGFVVPMAYYMQHMVDQGFQAQLESLHQDPEFLGDPVYRREELESLRARIRASAVDPELALALYDAVVASEGSELVMVRFRSSSNAEDSLLFSGAGLYDSTSVCVADSFDGDTEGPSLCDPDQPKERSIERGLLKVWSSLWSVAAWEERAWYGVEPLGVGMGVLVDTRSKDERSNIVAFTGLPSDPGDGRYLINAQVGWLDVVSAEPGVWPESTLLGLSSAGSVTQIERVSAGSEVDQVLEDARLEELGGALWQIEQVYPASGAVMLDTEWKVLQDGRLIVKQVRPAG